jgi:hypothetical protein
MGDAQRREGEAQSRRPALIPTSFPHLSSPSSSTFSGHLGASLGVTELTVALHYVFAAPEDRIVWDVGHQARRNGESA